MSNRKIKKEIKAGSEMMNCWMVEYWLESDGFWKPCQVIGTLEVLAIFKGKKEAELWRTQLRNNHKDGELNIMHRITKVQILRFEDNNQAEPEAR